MGNILNGSIFRKATISDLDAIIKIEQEGFDVDGFNRRQMSYLIKSKSACFYVTEIDQSIAGYIIMLIRSNSDQLRLYSIAVSPSFRGMGVGQSCLNLAEKIAREKLKTRLKLEVKTTNLTAIKLYERNFFLPKKVIAGYYKDGEDALIMTRSL